MKKVTEFLEQIGLSELEAKLYQGLLEMGPTTVMELAEHVGIKRITAHFNIESLIQKGLVVQMKNGARRQIIADSTNKLEMLIEEQESKIQNLKSELPDILNLVKSTIPASTLGDKVNVKYFEGKNNVKNIYKDSVKSQELRSYVNLERIKEEFPENFQSFFSNVKQGHLKIWRDIIEPSDFSKSYVTSGLKNNKYDFKFFPTGWNSFMFDYMIFDGKIAIITGKENITGILIENDSIYENSKIIFDMMWNLIP